MRKAPAIAPSGIPTAEQAIAIREARRTFGIISKSLSKKVQSSLSTASRSFNLGANTRLPLARGRRSFYSKSGKSSTAKGDDSTKRTAEIQSAYAQIISAGKSFTNDNMVAYAMTLDLPESYNTLKQTLWLRENLSASELQVAVQAEWERRGLDKEIATTNRTLGQARSYRETGTKGKISGEKKKWNEKWCSFHRSAAHNNNPLHSSTRALAMPRLYAVTQDCTTPKDTFVVDSEASHHMVNDASKLKDITTTSINGIKIGNGANLVTAGQGTLTLGPMKLHNVLVVPELSCNLLAAGKFPSTMRWVCYDPARVTGNIANNKS
nr:hypothetical protein L203_02042 [Cryptococcus depauperatus CBS 7841]